MKEQIENLNTDPLALTVELLLGKNPGANDLLNKLFKGIGEDEECGSRDLIIAFMCMIFATILKSAEHPSGSKPEAMLSDLASLFRGVEMAYRGVDAKVEHLLRTEWRNHLERTLMDVSGAADDEGVVWLKLSAEKEDGTFPMPEGVLKLDLVDGLNMLNDREKGHG